MERSVELPTNLTQKEQHHEREPHHQQQVLQSPPHAGSDALRRLPGDVRRREVDNRQGDGGIPVPQGRDEFAAAGDAQPTPPPGELTAKARRE